MENKFIIVTWPESQNLYDIEGFLENCCLVNDCGHFSDTYGAAAYFVNEDWYRSHTASTQSEIRDET